MGYRPRLVNLSVFLCGGGAVGYRAPKGLLFFNECEFWYALPACFFFFFQGTTAEHRRQGSIMTSVVAVTSHTKVTHSNCCYCPISHKLLTCLNRTGAPTAGSRYMRKHSPIAPAHTFVCMHVPVCVCVCVCEWVSAAPAKQLPPSS